MVPLDRYDSASSMAVATCTANGCVGDIAGWQVNCEKHLSHRIKVETCHATGMAGAGLCSMPPAHLADYHLNAALYEQWAPAPSVYQAEPYERGDDICRTDHHCV
jgi:hypothetical protein